jgi:aspartyl-tRNA(Asn)/glutamyl-tRNA(Gln) amidotransferase subunit C
VIRHVEDIVREDRKDLMKIGPREVENVARLARLMVSDDDVQRLSEQLNAILQYMDKLDALDTGGIEPMAHALALETPYREDEIQPSLNSEEALANAPWREDSFFKVPKVF